jgi:hypothetical protein
MKPFNGRLAAAGLIRAENVPQKCRKSEIIEFGPRLTDKQYNTNGRNWEYVS